MTAAAPWTVWSFPPLVTAAVVVSVGFFVQGWLRLRRRGRHDLASWGRLALFGGGLAVMTLAVVSPIDAVGEGYLQAGHMLQHVLLADLGVALVVLSLRGPMSVFFLPRDLLAPLARARWLRSFLGWLTRPRNVVLLWLVVVIGWHIPVLYETALSNRAAHDLQHLSFVLAGVLLWVVLLDPMRHGRLSSSERVGVAIVVFAAGQMLAYVMAFSYRAFYGVYAEQPVRLLGLSPLTDQKLSGVVMMAEQALTLGVFVAWELTRRARINAAESTSGQTESPP